MKYSVFKCIFGCFVMKYFNLKITYFVPLRNDNPTTITILMVMNVIFYGPELKLNSKVNVFFA